MKQLILFCLFFCQFSCVVNSEVKILSGKYISTETKEHVLISDNNIEFHLWESGENYVLKYNYSLYPDGTIWPSPITSVDAAFGIGKYHWYLIEGNIHKVDKKDSKTFVFKRINQ